MTTNYEVDSTDKVQLTVETSAPCLLNVDVIFDRKKIINLKGPTCKPVLLPPTGTEDPLEGKLLDLLIRLRKLKEVPVDPVVMVILEGGRDGRKEILVEPMTKQNKLTQKVRIRFKKPKRKVKSGGGSDE